MSTCVHGQVADKRARTYAYIHAYIPCPQRSSLLAQDILSHHLKNAGTGGGGHGGDGVGGVKPVDRSAERMQANAREEYFSRIPFEERLAADRFVT